MRFHAANLHFSIGTAKLLRSFLLAETEKTGSHIVFDPAAAGNGLKRRLETA